jgi:hypothetical protein
MDTSLAGADNSPDYPVNRLRWHSIISGIIKVAWIVMLVSLPFTSFPYLPPAIGGGALVRPFSIYPLIILMVLMTIPRMWRRPIPRTVLIVIPFILASLLSGMISLLRGIDPAYGITVFERIIRSLITIGIGFSYYLTISLMPRTLEDLKGTLRWIYVGMGIALAWGSLQAVYVLHWNKTWYQLLNKLQEIISIRRLIENRVSGFTYEPNWFAEQISMLLFPWLLASVLTGKSVFKWRWRWLTVEWIFLGWSVALIPLTFSRAGVLNLVVLTVLCLFVFRTQTLSWPADVPRPAVKFSKILLRRSLEAVVALVVVAGLLFAAGTRNEFFRRIWSYWLEKNNPNIASYLKYLGFGARFFYNETAYNTYKEYPFFGVGPGNYAFYFDENLVDRPLALTPEVLRIITPREDRTRLITSKNFFLRILAENGIVGAITFIAFLLAITGSAVYLWLSPDYEVKFWGIGGLLGITVFLLSSLSFDSFAFPNIWVIFGLVTAATLYFNRFSQGNPNPNPVNPAPAILPDINGNDL